MINRLFVSVSDIGDFPVPKEREVTVPGYEMSPRNHPFTVLHAYAGVQLYSEYSTISKPMAEMTRRQLPVQL